MIDREGFFMIRDMRARGMSIKQIAEAMDVDRKTVSKWVKSKELPQYKRKAPPKGKLEDYKKYVLSRMAEGCLNATVILEEIAERGYTGKITLLRDFMKPHRKTHSSSASIRYETPPGKQAQVDWGEFKVRLPDGKERKLHAFVMLLGHSRFMYVEFTEDEKIETLIGCHERAFRFFGGITETILYDNMRTVVKHSHEIGQNKWNDTFLRFAQFQGFNPIRCRPYNPRGKGKVENGVKYLRRNFWPRVTSVRSISELNEKVREWLDAKCNVRIHKTTHEIPAEAFLREALKPYREESFLNSTIASRKVMNDCMVQYETNLYSVPHQFVGKRIAIKDLKNGTLELYDEKGLYIDCHEKSMGRHQLRRKKKHFEGLVSRNHAAKAPTAPLMIPDASPKVYQRPLEIYDRLLAEVAE